MPTVGQQAAPPVAPPRDFQGQASSPDNANEIVAHYARTKARIFFLNGLDAGILSRFVETGRETP